MNDKIQFEWDENKNIENRRKHKISFEEATSVFADDDAIYTEDYKHSDNEDRFITIGKSYHSNILYIVYCERKENIIRIISARKAEKIEREVYYAHHRL